MSDFEATAQEFKAFTLPTIAELTDEHAAAAPAHALAGFKGDAIVLVVKDRYGAPQSVVVPDEGLFTLKVDVYLPATFDVLEFFPPLHAMQRVACERLLSVAPMSVKRLDEARLIVCEAPPDFHAEGHTLEVKIDTRKLENRVEEHPVNKIKLDLGWILV